MTKTADIDAMIASVALGDRAAFSSLYAATSAKLFGLCLRVLNDQAEAEDALQDVFVKVWRDASRYQANGLGPMTWLITVTRNHCIDRVRARKAAAGDMADAADPADAAPDPQARPIAAAGKSGIDDCLSQLPPNGADAVRRAYLEGDTYEALAARYGVPLNIIRTWLRRSLIKLRECLSS